MTGILRNNNQYPLAINGYRDHIHIFFELNPKNSISDIVRILKSNSSKWINDNNFHIGKFRWQEGYGAFSYTKSQRNNIIQYILKQNEHHKKTTFKEEYFKLLKDFEIKFDKTYLFDFNI